MSERLQKSCIPLTLAESDLLSSVPVLIHCEADVEYFDELAEQKYSDNLFLIANFNLGFNSYSLHNGTENIGTVLDSDIIKILDTLSWTSKKAIMVNALCTSDEFADLRWVQCLGWVDALLARQAAEFKLGE